MAITTPRIIEQVAAAERRDRDLDIEIARWLGFEAKRFDTIGFKYKPDGRWVYLPEWTDEFEDAARLRPEGIGVNLCLTADGLGQVQRMWHENRGPVDFVGPIKPAAIALTHAYLSAIYLIRRSPDGQRWPLPSTVA